MSQQFLHKPNAKHPKNKRICGLLKKTVRQRKNLLLENNKKKPLLGTDAMQ
jgi:hypothetical protein